LRQPRTTYQTEKTETNDENNTDPLAENLGLSALGEGLERALTQERVLNPTILEPLSLTRLEGTEERGKTRRKTMAATAEQGVTTASKTTRILNLEQMRQIITSLSGRTRGPKPRNQRFTEESDTNYGAG